MPTEFIEELRSKGKMHISELGELFRKRFKVVYQMGKKAEEYIFQPPEDPPATGLAA